MHYSKTDIHLLCYEMLFVFFSSFDFAFELARLSMKQKIPDIHLKNAMFLEDQVLLTGETLLNVGVIVKSIETTKMRLESIFKVKDFECKLNWYLFPLCSGLVFIM